MTAAPAGYIILSCLPRVNIGAIAHPDTAFPQRPAAFNRPRQDLGVGTRRRNDNRWGKMDAHEEYHIRFRIGSVFEIAWQLRGMQEFLMDIVSDPEIPRYIMARPSEVHLENTRRVLDLVGDRLDMDWP